MKKILFAVIVILLVASGFFLLSKKQTPQKLTSFSFAMDWTPNTNHTGIYVALQKGWYKQAGIDLKILPYSFSVSPDVLVATGKANAGISSTEGVVSDAAVGSPVVSIAAIIQHNTSSLVALSDSGIKTPKDFDGKTYGGFGAPFESAVVSEVIKKDGGMGKFTNVTLEVDQLQALQTKKVDFIWIFDGWTGIQAKHEGIKLITFPINTNGIADYYTPVIIASPKEIKENGDVLDAFMQVTEKGYAYAIAHPQEAVKILMNSVPKDTFTDEAFVQESQAFLSNHYVEKGRPWGLQDASAWHDYPQFMLQSNSILDANGKPVIHMDFDSLYTNEFIH